MGVGAGGTRNDPKENLYSDESRVELEQFDALMRSKRTAGQMIDSELDEFLESQPDLLNFLKKVTESRNRLIHRFYEEQVPNLNSEAGREFVVKEIEALAHELRVGCSVVKEIYMQLARARFQDVDAILEKTKKESLKRWSQ